MAVADFFDQAKLPPTPFLDGCREVKDEIYTSGALFSRGLPHLKLYYVTMGKWDEPEVVVHRIDRERGQLEATEKFESVTISAIGAKRLRELYFRTQKPVEHEFTLTHRVTLPAIPSVTQAYLGIVPATEYIRLLEDESGQLRKSLFTDNVRDFRGADNPVNASIADTLKSAKRDHFAILNNGVTIVARDLRVTGDKLFMRAYQIVNGGQTSHVLFDEQSVLDENVWVPIRVIGTDDDDLTTAVITATNSQTPIAAQDPNLSVTSSAILRPSRGRRRRTTSAGRNSTAAPATSKKSESLLAIRLCAPSQRCCSTSHTARRATYRR